MRTMASKSNDTEEPTLITWLKGKGTPNMDTKNVKEINYTVLNNNSEDRQRIVVEIRQTKSYNHVYQHSNADSNRICRTR